MNGADVVWRALVAAAVMALAAGSVSAKPQIKVENPNFDAGTVVEGVLEHVEHSFAVKNTGDEPLKISKVRAG